MSGSESTSFKQEPLDLTMEACMQNRGGTEEGAPTPEPDPGDEEQDTSDEAEEPAELRQQEPAGLGAGEGEDVSGLGGGGGGGGGLHACPLCGKCFSTPWVLKLHQERHGPLPYSCPDCGKSFARRGSGSYSLHLESCSCPRASPSPYRCADCGRSFKDFTYFTNHQKIHRGLSPFWCQVCGKNFAKASHLTSHQSTHCSLRLYSCKGCGESFRTPSLMGEHQCKAGNRAEKGGGGDGDGEGALYRCPDCDSLFGSLPSLVSHQQLIHQLSDELPYHCETCGERFAGAKELGRHGKTHKAKRHACGQCGKSFSYFANYYTHQQLHNGRPDLESKGRWRYRCRDCDRIFWDAQELREHRKVHGEAGGQQQQEEELGGEGGSERRRRRRTSDKKGKVAPKAASLDSGNSEGREEEEERQDRGGEAAADNDADEMEEEEEEKEVKKKREGRKPLNEGQHRCSFCGLRFKKKCHLEDHLLFHSGQKPYVCSECGKIFSHYPYFKSHLAVHRGARPFECPHCGKVFCVVSQLNRHARIHTGEKPYSCKVCGKSFADSTNCKRHQRSHLKDKQLAQRPPSQTQLHRADKERGEGAPTVPTLPAKRGRPSRSKKAAVEPPLPQ